MALNVTTSWSAPPVAALDFSDCTAAGAYYADDPTYINYTTILSLLYSVIPRNWTDNEPTDGQLLLWYETLPEEEYEDFFNRISNLVFHGCHREICPFLQLEGDPDLAGIGMMISYYLVATLATLYVFFFSLDSIKPFNEYKPPKAIRGLFKQTRSLFLNEQTLNLFLDTSLLFSISMLLAALYRFTSAFAHPDGPDNTFFYSRINAVTVSLFSVFPPLMLQFPARKKERKRIRAVLWFLVILFVITLAVLFYTWRGNDPLHKYFEGVNDDISRHWDQALWLIFCDLTPQRLKVALGCAIIVAYVVLGLNLPRWICLLLALRGDQRERSDPQHRGSDNVDDSNLRTILRALNITLCCATMWLLLGIFTAISARVADGMGTESKDRKLSVGQVLSVAAFVPLAIDMAAIVFAEHKPEKENLRKTTWSFHGGPSHPTKATTTTV